MAKLLKNRKYQALYNKGTNTWFTGYPGSYNVQVDRSDNHEIRHLELQYYGYTRGRSAANVQLRDEHDNLYLMSMSGFDLLMKLTDAPAAILREENLTQYDIQRKTSLVGGGVWFTGSFCQTKQGENYFIEPVEVR